MSNLFNQNRLSHEEGTQDGKQEVIKALESYFDLTQFSQQVEGAPPNPEWDRGFQAAIAIAKGTLK